MQIVCRGFKSNTSVMSFLTLQYYQGHLSPQKALLILMESLVNLEGKQEVLHNIKLVKYL